MTVVDASVAFAAAVAPDGFALLGGELVAPPLLWPELRSVLHVAVRRALVSDKTAVLALHAVDSRVEQLQPPQLGIEVWAIGNHLGWAKSYDAEYLALARIVHRPLATLDSRMHRAADRLGIELFDLSR